MSKENIKFLINDTQVRLNFCDVVINNAYDEIKSLMDQIDRAQKRIDDAETAKVYYQKKLSDYQLDLEMFN